MRNITRPLIVLPLLLAVVAAQSPFSLMTTYASNNGQAGNFFDVVAQTPVMIDTLDVNLDPGTWDMEFYIVTGGGTHVGVETMPTAWTMVNSVTNLASNGTNTPTPIGVSLGVAIPANQTQGFYVTVSNGTAINYTNGSTLGAIYAQDMNIQVLEGRGASYSFASLFTPRVWNGTVHYSFLENRLQVSQNLPGALTVDLSMINPAANEGWTLISTMTTLPQGSGPFAGIVPDAGTWFILVQPALVGNPFHFVRSPVTYPDVPLDLPPGTISAFVGQTWDLVVILFDPSLGFVGASNVERLVIQ